ncbi:tetratricopeptide repeat protein [Nitzschia inconspicua]|uniref:Tetratricopeptide repeat protein n=2 Tax=Nitzschia inconspicua TaxID=303405 RepID=A0A9K3K5J6_9STRA|nr:tetratricopeptide repeat protein [Nitzschia inconspicua]
MIDRTDTASPVILPTTTLRCGAQNDGNKRFRVLVVSFLLAGSFLHHHTTTCHSLMLYPSSTHTRSRILSRHNSNRKSKRISMISIQDTWSNTEEKIYLNPKYNNGDNDDDKNNNNRRRVRKKYQRKRIPETERERRRLSIERQQQYEKIVKKADGTAPSIWSFESLFPKAVWDEEMIDQDLYGVSRRDQTVREKSPNGSPATSLRPSTSDMTNTKTAANPTKTKSKLKTSAIGASSMMRLWREPKLSSISLPYDSLGEEDSTNSSPDTPSSSPELTDEQAEAQIYQTSLTTTETQIVTDVGSSPTTISEDLAAAAVNTNSSARVDFQLTRMVEDRIYGYRRGTNLYDTSLMGDGAVKFREGIRLGNPLRVNADRLNYHAKKEFRSNKVEEAQELYEEAIRIDPRDGRAYLGLARCAEWRRDFKLARECLRMGIAQSVSCAPDGTPDTGANPFLLQSLGCLEEKIGRLSEAESLYISAVRSRPSHAASWVALAQLRTRRFRQGASAGRVCFQAAERELKKAGLPPSAWVYTAWASMEYKKAGDVRRARQLYKEALKADKRCSAAWLQLGCMEADNEHWKEAELCFETVMKFDQRNTRVLQAYAIMESKRPEVNTRKVIGLFEKALKVNPRDAGVLQPYALFVAKLGDIDAARDLLRRGTEANKRHAPVWQAWGVLETREGNSEEARNIFQQGIWACAQLTGGQSGGYNCARLWQAWGVLEAAEGDYAAARRCFSRALDADNRNMAAMTAWTLMEEKLGNVEDARHLYERSLQQFAPGTAEKQQLWRAYELMEKNTGNEASAQEVYRRCMRESFAAAKEEIQNEISQPEKETTVAETQDSIRRKETEVEVSRWNNGSTSMKAEIWLTNDGDIESMVPKGTMSKKKSKPSSTSTRVGDS